MDLRSPTVRPAARVVIAVAVAATLTACRQPEPEPPKMQVRLVTSAPLSGRWEREAERGLGRVGVELDAHVARLRAEDGETRRRVLADLGRTGVDLVFCVGSGFEAMLYAEVEAYPDTRYVLLPGSAHGANVAGVRFLTDGVGYMAGAVASALAGQGRAGILRGPGGPWLEELEAGFIDGLAARGDRRPPTVAEGAEGAWQLLDAGVTVALYSADVADDEVLAAAHDAGLILVAADSGAVGRTPNVVLAAIEIDVAEAMVRVTREVADGAFTSRVYAFDVGSGVLDVVLGADLPPARADAARTALATARSEVTAGFVEVETLGM
jgi:basic membrane lipoprotein Med (substrate-binding protein (PBP1-ABC) superfamily)